MRSFTIKLQDFFKLNNGDRAQEINFDPSKRKMLIPMYQREYKWTNDKIKVLISDIEQRVKFLGIVILDETQSCYEIVDGQQRITTCYLALIALYNYYAGSQMEQESLLSYIKPYEKYVLCNDSVGEYIVSSGNTLRVKVEESADIYYQKENFEAAYYLIYDHICSLPDGKAREFKRQLLDCDILVMINEQHGNTCPIEQIFLDINEKSQLLEPEDIFKGHCFENFDESHHQKLKETWTKLKSCGMRFKRDFGYEDLSEYLYLYLLECVDKNMPENLSPNDRHYLEGKDMDETFSCLTNMIEYGEKIIAFREKLNDTTYRFEDLCREAHAHGNTNDHIVLKAMSSSIIDYPKAQYQKLPFLQFIKFLSVSETLQGAFAYSEFRKCIVNLYIYAALFVFCTKRKSKKDIDRTVLDELRRSDVKGVIAATKTLRESKVQDFTLSDNSKEEELRFAYSISDHYVCNTTWLPETYVENKSYNREHFLIPDNKNRRVRWVAQGEKQIYLPGKYSKLKKKAMNFLIMDKELNESLLDYDIITKIEMIRAWFLARNQKVPNHMNVFFEHIEGLDAYEKLKELKSDPLADDGKITAAYCSFLDQFFEEDTKNVLLGKLTECFRNAFRNQDAE